MNTPHFNRLTHLPYCDAIHASPYHATKFKLCGESLLSVPRSVVLDGIVSYGGSTGMGLDLPRKAYGEFFERNHLFTAVPIHTQKTLAQVEPSDFREKLLTLCQYDPSQLKKMMDHPFSFTTVHHLLDGSTRDYFYNAICLNGVKADAPYLSFSDSCGCAAHPNKDSALHHSLMEFLERQALLGSWLSQRYKYMINPIVLKEITPYYHLTEKLLTNGELYIFENGNELPGYTVMMFYFSASKKDKVQYSVGSSSGLSLMDALTSALEELYQCYTFLYNMESSGGLENKAGSGYHVSFQKCNRLDTRATIPFFQQLTPFKINTADELRALKIFTQQEILAQLSAFSTDIFYYHHYEQALNLHFTKIMSPDFFAHMSLHKPLNLANPYAKKLGITRENAYWEKIPFP